MYSCLTELFKIELIICIKMDLALNNLQRLICHKTQTNNQPTNALGSIMRRSNTEGTASESGGIIETQI